MLLVDKQGSAVFSREQNGWWYVIAENPQNLLHNTCLYSSVVDILETQ
jgi:hypothetical protein